MPDPRLSAAVEHHKSDRLLEAETLYRAILSDDPSHPDICDRLGDIAYRTGHFEDAARLLHQAVQQQPENPVTWKSLIEALVKAGFDDDAAKVLEEGQRLGLLTVTPSAAPTDSQLGEFLPEAPAQSDTGLDQETGTRSDFS